MSFAAEPYGVFVEDLVANLTGGVSRVRFRFVEEELPFRLANHERVRPETLRVHGLADAKHRQFVVGTDLDVLTDGTLQWRFDADEPSRPAAGATWPDVGSIVWVGFDRLPGGPPPPLTDRNPGSVTRTLAESFALEYAVLSMQLEAVYQAAFVGTATGRDLENLAALVGLDRRGSTVARGEVVLRRSAPTPADIVVVAGTRVSTDAAPLVTVETTDTVTLRRGTVSVAAPVRALIAGPTGRAAERTLTVLHRPILGVEDVLNPTALTLGGGAETDDELRSRIQRALETAGAATVGAVRGALGAIDGIREQDVHIEEDHLAHPGLIVVTVAANIDQDTAAVAAAALEQIRPAGVRIEHNLIAARPQPISLATDTGGGGDGPVSPGPASPPSASSGVGTGGVPADVWQDLHAEVTVTPADSTLPPGARERLAMDVHTAVLRAIDNIGVGEPLVYNRIVAAGIGVDGVLDLVVDIAPKDKPLARFNVHPESARARPRFAAPDDLQIVLRGDRVVLDLAVSVERRGLTAALETGAALSGIRQDIEQRLAAALLTTPNPLTPAALLGLLPATDAYVVEDLTYRLELLDEGLRVTRQDAEIVLDPGQQVWVRSVVVTEDTQSVVIVGPQQ